MLQETLCNVLSLIAVIISNANLVNARDVKPQREHYTPDYRIYHNVSFILTHLHQYSNKYGNYFHLDLSYKSRSRISQPVIRLTNFTHLQQEGPFHNTPVDRPRILLSFGEHAREFLPVESMFYLLQNVTSGLEPNADIYAAQYSKYILNNVDIFIVALMNPDGRLLIEKSGNYCWRGTRTGVDLNRNFDWNFGGSHGSSKDPEDEEYCGPHAFSEPETQVLVDLTQKYKFDAFVSLHSGTRQIYVPYADSASRAHHSKPKEVDAMLDLAQRMAGSVRGSKRFKYGVAYTLSEYTADGTIFDYMAGKRNIPFSFAIELWGSGNSDHAKCFDLFNPKSDRLKSAVKESFPIFETLLQHLILYKQGLPLYEYQHVIKSTSSVSKWTLIFLVILCVLSLIIHSRQMRMRPACAILPCVRTRPKHRRVVSLRSLSSAFSVLSVFKIS